MNKIAPVVPHIGYRTDEDEVIPLYSKQLDSARSLSTLLDVLRAWGDLVPDAWEARPKTPFEFKVWREFLLHERGCSGKNEPMTKELGERIARWGPILIPARFIRASFVAKEFKAPSDKDVAIIDDALFDIGQWLCYDSAFDYIEDLPRLKSRIFECAKD